MLNLSTQQGIKSRIHLGNFNVGRIHIIISLGIYGISLKFIFNNSK